MNAADARKLTDASKKPSPKAAEGVLALWHRAIKKAATEKRCSVRESDIGRLRMPITDADRQAALDELMKAGFRIAFIKLNGNDVIEVSW